MTYIEQAFKKIETFLSQQSVTYLLFGSLGTIIGLVLAWLISVVLIGMNIRVISDVIPFILVIGLLT